jgi:hypothetical protein
MKYLIKLVLLLSLIINNLHAQVDNGFRFDDEPITQITPVDTTASDSMKIVENSFFEIFKGKPGKAALMSLVIPSGGQIYNKKWWKVPLALGIDGFTGYLIWYNTNQYNEFDKIYKDLLLGIEDNKYNLKVSDASIALNQRNIARQNREYSWVGFIIGHLVTVFDAFVDRHLMTFDISDDLSFNFKSSFNTFPSLSLNIPISTKTDLTYYHKSVSIFR